MNGEQRYRQATTKARILSNRNLRKFLADEIDWLPMAKDREFIISEFDRLQAEIDRLRRAMREIDFYSTDPWARNKVRIALSPSHSPVTKAGHDPA